jgi:hypothetical protein
MEGQLIRIQSAVHKFVEKEIGDVTNRQKVCQNPECFFLTAVIPAAQIQPQSDNGAENQPKIYKMGNRKCCNGNSRIEMGHFKKLKKQISHTQSF